MINSAARPMETNVLRMVILTFLVALMGGTNLVNAEAAPKAMPRAVSRQADAQSVLRNAAVGGQGPDGVTATLPRGGTEVAGEEYVILSARDVLAIIEK